MAVVPPLAQLRHLAERFPISVAPVSGLSSVARGRLAPIIYARLNILGGLNRQLSETSGMVPATTSAFLNRPLCPCLIQISTLTPCADHIDAVATNVGPTHVAGNPLQLSWPWSRNRH